MEKIKIAVVGCGGIFANHWTGYIEQRDKGFNDFEIVAFCDLIPERAQAYADKYEEAFGTKAKVFSSVDALIASDVDYKVASVQVPHSEHHKVAIPLMRAGKHIMIEKPLAITMRAAKMMMDEAKKCGVVLKVLENYRYAVSERAAAWAVKSGMIGTPRMVTMMDVGLRQWYWEWRDHKYIAGGAWTIDGGIHFADLWMNILGPVRRVTAIKRTYDNIRYKKFAQQDESQQAKENATKYRKTRSLLSVNPDTFGEPIESDLEDTTSALLEFDNGVIGTWLVTRSAPGFVDRGITIAGSEGSLKWYVGIIDYAQNIVVTWEDLQKQYLESLTKEESEFWFPGGLRDTMALEQREFFDFLKGERELEVTADTGYLDMAIPYAVYESAEKGDWVTVQDVMDLKEEAYQSDINKKVGIE
ncbi:MAG: Gfo/Idh/MocA family oxidoreductase [Clostridia bacterium]|nr:Gfo/Idh/MocA family oxidoreductase [Clostridia bacterium]